MARALSLALCLALFTITRCAACKLDQCTRIYNMKLEEEGIPGPEATPAFCSVLSAYGHCVHATTRSCRGNLKFHTTVSLLNPLKVRFNCTKHTGTHSHRPLPPPQAVPPPPPPPAACTFHGRNRFRHCGLFGDPHLKTFNNEYQTCRVRGAWPLIDNPYLAVQVTNDPVLDGSLATATTKVTIIIKGRSTPCTTEKTYEATADTALPATFIDGTNRSGPDQSVVIASSQGAATSGAARERVEIYLRYIETTLVIRRVGKYLAFSAKLPEELVDTSQGEENLQLCKRGCPPGERLDLVRARGHAVTWEEALHQCRDTGDLGNDIVNNLTDYYLDWCVFDAMTAGVGSEFTAAAHSAQADVLRMDPASLQNRTAPLQLSQPAPSAAPVDAPTPLHRLLLVFTLVLLAGLH